MDHIFANRKRAENAVRHTEADTAQPSLDALRSGAAQPTQEQMGHRVDLPEAMRDKMESAFGADLSAVKLYESEAVADAGANAVARGSDIAFAPGMLDFTSYGGQALLGHEISHVVSQARGEVSGGGFLNDHALEARADREGAMAAAGQQVAMPTAAMSSVTAASAAGPMQADKAERKAKRQERKGNKKLDELFRLSAGRSSDWDVDRDMKVDARYKKMLYGLSDRELDMLNQRSYDAKLGVKDFYEHQATGSDPEKRLRTALSDPSSDASIYEGMLKDFQMGPDVFQSLEDYTPENAALTESYATRSSQSTARVNALMADRLADVREGEELSRGSSSANDFSKTDEGMRLESELKDAQTSRFQRIFRKGR